MNKLYGLYVQKCSDDILYQILGDGYNCKNDSEIDYYFDSLRGGRIMHFYFVNNYINILDYDNPINKFIYRMETPLYKEQYSTNSININPVLVRTHNGLILDNIKDDVTYMLDRNDVYISERKGANMYMAYCFFLKNNKEYYERTYKRIQEVISSIGGINQAITIIAIYLNYLYNNYVVLSDTEMLLHSLIHTEKKNHRKKSIELRNLNNRIKETPKEKKINSNDIKKSSDQRKFGETIDNRAKKNKTENNIAIFHQNIDIIKHNTNKTENNISYTKDQLNNKVEDLTMDNGELGKRKNFEKMKTFKDYDRYKSEKSFCNYLCFFISCSKKKRFFKVYQDFRIKIISEEHLIRNHLNIYNLLKITEKKRHIRRNSYHLDDLMNLV